MRVTEEIYVEAVGVATEDARTVRMAGTGKRMTRATRLEDLEHPGKTVNLLINTKRLHSILRTPFHPAGCTCNHTSVSKP